LRSQIDLKNNEAFEIERHVQQRINAIQANSKNIIDINR
jgi:hypothetical protein